MSVEATLLLVDARAMAQGLHGCQVSNVIPLRSPPPMSPCKYFLPPPPPSVFIGGIRVFNDTFAEFIGLSGPAANDDRSGESENGSAGNSFHDPEIDPADGHHDSSRNPGITPADGNEDSSLDAGIDGKRTSKAGQKTAHVDSCNRDKRAKAGGKACGNQSGNDDAVESSNYHNNSIAKAGGKARGNQSGNDDAVESSDYHNNSIPDDKTHGSGRARKPPAKKL